LRSFPAGLAVLLCVLAGCAGDGVELPTPWGIVDIEGGGAGAEPESVRAAKERAAADQITVSEGLAKIRALEACVSRVRHNAQISPCQCYFELGMVVPPDCAAVPPDASTPPDGESTLPVDESGPPADESPNPGLRERLMAREGGPHLVPFRGHICYGHWIRPWEDFKPDDPLTVGECEIILDIDLRDARTEALRVFGQVDDARVELCYWTACHRFAYFTGAPALAEAVRADEKLSRTDPARANRIATAIEQGE